MAELPPAFYVLILILAAYTFETAYSGRDIIHQSFPPMLSVNFSSCEGDFFAVAGCGIVNMLDVLADFFLFLFGIVILIGNFMTFTLPGAPVALNVILTTALIFVGAWSIASLVRGVRS